MSWQVVYGANTYYPLDVSITKRLNGLNSATMQLKELIPIGSTVTIKFNGVDYFTGIVTGVNTDEYSVNSYNLVESAIELDQMIVDDGTGNYVFTLTNQTVDAVVDTILAGSGWTRQSSDTTVISAISSVRALKKDLSRPSCKKVISLYL